MLRTILGVVGVSSLLLAAPLSASAADMPLKAPMPPVPVTTWTGCYVDGGIGYGIGSADHYNETYPGFVATSDTVSSSVRGWLGRVGGGCDYQISKFVVGVLADYDFMNLNGTSELNGVEGTAKASHAWYAGGRAGMVLAPGILSYFDVGFTQIHVDQTNLFTTTLPPVATGLSSSAQTFNGWFLGGGTETSLSDWLPGLPSGLFLRTEYRYASYSAQDTPVIVTATGALSGAGSHTTPYVQTVTTSLVWRFNWTR